MAFCAVVAVGTGAGAGAAAGAAVVFFLPNKKSWDSGTEGKGQQGKKRVHCYQHENVRTDSSAAILATIVFTAETMLRERKAVGATTT
jgi:hypothetical protein